MPKPKDPNEIKKDLVTGSEVSESAKERAGHIAKVQREEPWPEPPPEPEDSSTDKDD